MSHFTNKLSIAALLAGTTLTFMASAGAQELRGWNQHAPDYPVSTAMERFAELVEERTEGRITADVFHNAELGEQDFAIEQMQFGGIDFAVFNMVPLNNIVPASQATTLPYAFRSLDHMHTVMDGEIGQEIGAAMEEAGMVALAWYDSGARSFYASVPLETIDDFEGLKIRVQSSDMFVALVEALGANATPIPFGELYSAIQSGVVEGAENNWPSYEYTNHYSVAPYYILDEHSIVPEIFAVSKPVWDGLSAEDQEIVREAALESQAFQREEWAKRDEESEKIVREAGTTVIEVEDKTPFIEAMQPVYEEFAADPVVADLLERIQNTE
ncbi:TRAP transporter substrate-binding protein [Pararhizobium haloflavum]|uniref:TRAP transporter substrate-binding protein n=1 Tax=Pararhizobium haloflavum TaxID=2037914 RepID=UPI000C19E8BE|nr:TRAP transporter substrate-binding protein [Pararhizobium haloflavum]